MQKGFTLVELAIVLVIIGLIVGGVLVGQDMIKSAELRSTINQWQSYKTAIYVFKDKYGHLPGDIEQNLAAQYGFYDRTGAAAVGNGDGNGIISRCAVASFSGIIRMQQDCERVLFWRDLSDAQLIKDVFQTATEVTTAVTSDNMSLYFPSPPLGNGNFWFATHINNRNFLFLGGASAIAANGSITTSQAITPAEAFYLDNKVDDGLPIQGIIKHYIPAGAGATLDTPAAPASGVCVSNVGDVYSQTTDNFANTPSCNYISFPM